MRYVPDTTGRFSMRPHFDPAELDAECEWTITGFMKERCGKFELPIPTDILTKLIERDAADLDLYSDLSGEGLDVQGVTDFLVGERPRVRIAKELSEEKWRSNRLRTTLTHEYGHVKFHSYLYQLEAQAPKLFSDPKTAPLTCKRGGIMGAPKTDWMEWQAGYVCGSILMPVSYVKRMVSDYVKQHKLPHILHINSPEVGELLFTVSERFEVSEEAARVRLLKLGFLTDRVLGPSLFD